MRRVARPTPLVLLAVALLSLDLTTAARAQLSASSSTTDREAVRQAALDYVEALYEVDSTRITRSVHPDLVKYGYYTRDGRYRSTPMTYEDLKTLATRWNANQKRVDPDSARKKAVVLDVLDKTASAKVVAHWGIDYMHLAKTDGKWMIRQVLWQSHPPQR